METYHMVQELAAQGVADVIPLPDGVVIGRHNLGQVTADATAAMQQALQEAAVRLTSSSSGGTSGGGGGGSDGSSPGGRPGGSGVEEGTSSVSSVLASAEGAAGIASLNTVSERGVGLQVRHSGRAMDMKAQCSHTFKCSTCLHSSLSCNTCHTVPVPTACLSTCNAYHPAVLLSCFDGLNGLVVSPVCARCPHFFKIFLSTVVGCCCCCCNNS
jgi:hypothetical protein